MVDRSHRSGEHWLLTPVLGFSGPEQQKRK